jgi:hypothetical protein
MGPLEEGVFCQGAVEQIAYDTISNRLFTVGGPFHVNAIDQSVDTGEILEDIARDPVLGKEAVKCFPIAFCALMCSARRFLRARPGLR